MRFASNKCHNARNFITFLLLFAKLTYPIYLINSVNLNAANHRFSIGFNTFIQATTAFNRDVTAIKTLMNSLRLLCNWAIHYHSLLLLVNLHHANHFYFTWLHLLSAYKLFLFCITHLLHSQSHECSNSE